ncbi:MAG: primosomal protein N' [Candidatus Cloacimonetes bacterium]|nr:primosomal protein N' [Candidatus Cloacimonadota bacterium]
MIAEVLIPRPIFKRFHYRIPQEWESFVFSGSRVLVPFGNLQMQGLVANVLEDSGIQPDMVLKPILRPLEPFEAVDRISLEVIESISERTIQPEGEVASLFYPRYEPPLISNFSLSPNLAWAWEQIPVSRKQLRQGFSRLCLSNHTQFSMDDLRSISLLSDPLIRDLKKLGVILETPGFEREEILPIKYLPTAGPSLSNQQTMALDGILEEPVSRICYLHGVTGSGKTEVYQELCQHVLNQGLGALILVPEIALTPQIKKRFYERFGELVTVIHSGLGDKERYKEWALIQAGYRRLVIGARSALFVPLRPLGLLVVDEEGESSYRQDTAPFYDARQVAEEIASRSGARLVFGSATPSIQAYSRIKSKEFAYFEMGKRHYSQAMPDIRIIDLKTEFHNRNLSVFSKTLKEALLKELKEGNQAILFVNRRGHSSFVMCRNCSHVLECEHCKVSLTYHDTSMHLHCHYCDYRTQVPEVCPQCQSTAIKYFGIGTQKVEWFFQKEFPGVRYARLDTDISSKKGASEAILNRMQNNEIQVLIGTQMIAKGLDFDNVTLVGILNPDAIVKMSDYSAAEKALQLFVQIAGRAGRRSKQGTVFLQTYQPEHPVYRHLLTQNTRQFLEEELKMREELNFPPSSILIHIQTNSEIMEQAQDAIHSVHAQLTELLKPTSVQEITPPQKSPIEKIDRRWRYRFLVKTKYSQAVWCALRELREGFRAAGQTRLKIMVDPDNLL